MIPVNGDTGAFFRRRRLGDLSASVLRPALPPLRFLVGGAVVSRGRSSDVNGAVSSMCVADDCSPSGGVWVPIERPTIRILTGGDVGVLEVPSPGLSTAVIDVMNYKVVDGTGMLQGTAKEAVVYVVENVVWKLLLTMVAVLV